MSPEEVAALRLKRWTVGLLAAGFTAAIVIFVLAQSPADNPLGYDPMDTKQYVHDLEVYGGQANVLAAQFERWFLDLWRGRNLAYTVAISTLLLVWIVRFFGKPVPEEEEDAEEASPLRDHSGPRPVQAARRDPERGA
jgi:hypothetical protein